VRQRLALLVAAAMSLVLTAFLLPLALLVRTVAADRAVGRATAEAQALVPVIASGDRISLQLAVEALGARGGHEVTVFLPDGAVVGAASSRTPGVELAAHGNSISVNAANGREVLIAVGLPNGTAVVRTMVRNDELTSGVRRSWLILALLGVVLLALGIAVTDRLARRIVRPIAALAAVSHRLAGGALDARAKPAGPPEVRAVAAGLNHLAGRIQDLIWAEREAVADLSHRLRTPLTALRLDADALPDHYDAERITAHVETLDRAITALIEETRRRRSGPGVCDAAEVVAERIAFWAVLAEEQLRATTFSVATGPLPVGVSRANLAPCLDALLGNVFSHTPDGAPFSVRLVRRPGGGAVLTVADAGPGFGEMDPLLRGASGRGSTGLGLDIARQTARTSGGTLTIGRVRPHGALVTVELGPPVNPAR
jgi:signal transduction histidine kinase